MSEQQYLDKIASYLQAKGYKVEPPPKRPERKVVQISYDWYKSKDSTWDVYEFRVSPKKLLYPEKFPLIQKAIEAILNDERKFVPLSEVVAEYKGRSQQVGYDKEVEALMQFYGKNIFCEECGSVGSHFPGCSQFKKPTRLFISEDGKDIFYGDSYWAVHPVPERGHDKWRVWSGLAGANPMNLPDKNPASKYFSTKEKADEYVFMNNPVLSLNDLLSVWDEGSRYHQEPEQYANAPLFLNFKNLAKKKA